jgi:hypothetical protein
MNDSQQVYDVHGLRAQGLAPKQIARRLGMRPAEVLAVLNRPVTESPGQRTPEVRCWVSSSWAKELRVTGHSEWPGLDVDVAAPGGLVCVLVARKHRHDKVSVCGYLVDVHCLGVKNALGPRQMDELDLVAFRRHFFGAYDADPVAAPLELAQQLVFGAVDYARGLGFEPHPDYAADVATHLGDPARRCDIQFGRDGMPFYVQGPYDDARKILRTLDASVGPGNYHFLATGSPYAVGA